MVSDVLIGTLTLAGAIISGVIGVVYSEYRSSRERQKDLKTWYTNVIRMTERIERVRNDKSEPDDQVYVRNTCSGILGSLKDLIMRAPSGIEESVLFQAELFARECQMIAQIKEEHLKRNPGILDEPFEPLLYQARQTKEEVEQARDEVRPF